MSNLLKRMIAVLLSVVMAAAMCTPALALDDRTEQYARKAAAAGISKAAGKIPYVGGVISDMIDTFLPDMLGIPGEHDALMAKLDEIYDAVLSLDLKMDKQQQALFQEFYQQRITDFNNSANKIKGTIDRLYTRLVEIERDYEGSDQDEKQVALATLISGTGFDDPNSAMSQLINLTDYICGTQISNEKEDGIFQLAYKASCKDSLLGCEAAIKSSEYVNRLSRYLETAYKTLFAISAAKLYVCENNERIAGKMADGTIAKCDISSYTAYNRQNINSVIFGDNKSSLLEYYNRLYDESRADSAINLYNNMIADVWFSYIDRTDYTQRPARISYIPLDPEIGFLAPADVSYRTVVKIDYEYISESMDVIKTTGEALTRYGAYDNPAQMLNKQMLEAAHSSLSAEQMTALLQHMANNPAYGTDKADLSYIQVLEDLGFSFGEYNAYVDSLPKTNTGTAYRNPNLPRAQTDGKFKVFPVEMENRYEKGNLFPKGWCGTILDGYNFNDDPNTAELIKEAELIRMCVDPKDKNDKPGDYVMSNTMILYFAKAENSSAAASFFAGLSSATVPIICVGAAALIAAPIIIIARRKKKERKEEKVKN